MKPDSLFQSEHEVHIVNSVPARSLQQIVDHRDDEQLIFDFLQVDQALVRIYNLFQIRVLIRNEGKAMIRIILLVDPLDLYEVDLSIQIRRSENTAREITTNRNEIDLAIKTILQLTQTLVNLRQMLMRERLIDRHIIVTPTEMRSSGRLHARSRRSRDRVHVQIGVQHQMLRQRQNRQLDTCGETSRIRHMVRATNPTTVQLRKPVHEIMLRPLDPIIHTEIDNLHIRRHRMAFHELSGITMRGAEEQNIDTIQRQSVREH